MRLLGNFGPQGKITFLGSDTHYAGKAALETYPPVLPNDLEKLVHPDADKKGEEIGRGFKRYGLSKLVVVMCMFELNRRLAQDSNLKHLSAVAQDPGGIPESRTWSAPGLPWVWRWAMAIMSPLLPVVSYVVPKLRSVDDAAKDLVEISVGEGFVREKGYFEMMRKGGNSTESEDQGMQRRLWEKSLEWAGVGMESTVLEGAFD